MKRRVLAVGVGVFSFVIFSGWYGGLNMLERGISQSNCLFAAVALSSGAAFAAALVLRMLDEEKS